MSMSFYAYREAVRGAEFSEGPNCSNANARMILRSLGYGEEILDDYGQPGPLDPCELALLLPTDSSALRCSSQSTSGANWAVPNVRRATAARLLAPEAPCWTDVRQDLHTRWRSAHCGVEP